MGSTLVNDDSTGIRVEMLNHLDVTDEQRLALNLADDETLNVLVAYTNGVSPWGSMPDFSTPKLDKELIDELIAAMRWGHKPLPYLYQRAQGVSHTYFVPSAKDHGSGNRDA